MGMRLLKMKVAGVKEYTTLIEEWEDICIVANRGVDASGRQIERLTILCSDGEIRNYSPQQIESLAEYELALNVGNKRFGVACKHGKVINGKCVNCLRAVIVKR